jgi:hypothetical protein
MLRRFYYLDSATLEQYISEIEDGLVSEETRRELNGGTVGGGIDTKLIRADGEKSRETETSRVMKDNDGARFSRLLKAGELQPDALGWVEVNQPAVDFKEIGIGAMVSWECELTTPEFVHMASSFGQAAQAMKFAAAIKPRAAAFGLDTSQLPDESQIDAASEMIEALNLPQMVVGVEDGSQWKVFAEIKQEWIKPGDLDGPKRIVGKVIRTVDSGKTHELVKIPGANLGNREQRRQQQRTNPGMADKGQTLRGPAVELELLAIYI